LFILKGFIICDNGTSVIRTVLSAVQSLFRESGPGGVDDDSTKHESCDNWAFTLGTTLDIALPVWSFHGQTTVLAQKTLRKHQRF
jgi:hypothetical protein